MVGLVYKRESVKSGINSRVIFLNSCSAGHRCEQIESAAAGSNVPAVGEHRNGALNKKRAGALFAGAD
jgi:hypothetical protein